MYQSIFINKQDWMVYLWDDQHGMTTFQYPKYAYRRQAGGKFKSLYGDELEKVFNFDENDPHLFESDVSPEMRVLIDAYEESDEPSVGHKVVVIDIEVDSTGGFPDITKGDKIITAIALYDQFANRYYSLVLDPDQKIANNTKDDVETISFRCEENLLGFFLNKWDEIKPTILSGWNCIPVNQTVWLKDRIVRIGKITSNDLFDSKLIKKSVPMPKEKWTAELSNGQKIHSSGDHKFPVKIVNPSEYITFATSSKSNFIEHDLKMRQIQSFNDCADVYCGVQLRKNDNGDNQSFSFSNLYLAGLIYTDGSLKDREHPDYGYTVYQSDEELMLKLNEFGVDGKMVGPNKGCYARYIRKDLVGNAHDLIYDGTHRRLNLEELSTLSYKQFMAFLSGLLDGDGYKSSTKIEWCNYNGDLDVLHELCNWNGIYCSQRKNSLRFFYLNIEDLSLCKSSRWKNFVSSDLQRTSKQKSSQIRFKRIGDVVWTKVKKVEYVGTSTSMMDIETDTHYFVSKGIRTHNCNGFDMPYLFNRLRRVLGKQAGYRLSPIGIAYQNKFNNRMTIAGISCLDYMELYKKFIGVMKPSWSLGNVAKDEELKHQKLTYKGSLTDLYKNDIHRYIEYNLTDVMVVVELDKKYDFIHLARAVCHKGHVPYEWFHMSSRFIDGAILMYLRRHNLVAPNKPIGGREEYEEMAKNNEDGFAGAFVKEPVPGLYDWITSADITSLYPSVIMTLNISPETKASKITDWDAMKFWNGNAQSLRIGERNCPADDFKKMIADNAFGIAANGVIYKQPRRKIVGKVIRN
jgi:hypothetical protein